MFLHGYGGLVVINPTLDAKAISDASRHSSDVTVTTLRYENVGIHELQSVTSMLSPESPPKRAIIGKVFHIHLDRVNVSR